MKANQAIEPCERSADNEQEGKTTWRYQEVVPGWMQREESSCWGRRNPMLYSRALDQKNS